MTQHDRLSLFLRLCLPALLLASCGKSPQKWFDAAKAREAQGDPQGAVDAFDKALAQPGDWKREAQLLRARSLMELSRFSDAEKGAEDAALGLAPADARPARVLALQACAAAGDVAEGRALLGLLGGTAALADPDVASAAAKLGLAPLAAFAGSGTAAVAPGAAAPKAAGSRGAFRMADTDAVRLGIARVDRVEAADPSEFPLRIAFQDPRLTVKVPSPDGRHLVWRGKDKKGYWLFTSQADGSGERKLTACKNGFQPVWSPDSKHILYSAMDWRLEERNLFIYDVAAGKSRRAFNARRKVGALASWSPDGSKIVFSYYDDLWVMNADGIGRSLLNLASRVGKPVDEATLIAWSRDGNRLAYQMRGDTTVYAVEFAPKY